MPRNTITLSQAQEWAKNWNIKKVQYLKDNDLKAFRIPAQVIADVTSPQQVQDIRTYFGLDSEMNPHLMIVGVDSNGNDLIDPDNGLNIYNFSHPCPSTCNQSTPFINK